MRGVCAWGLRERVRVCACERWVCARMRAPCWGLQECARTHKGARRRGWQCSDAHKVRAKMACGKDACMHGSHVRLHACSHRIGASSFTSSYPSPRAMAEGRASGGRGERAQALLESHDTLPLCAGMLAPPPAPSATSQHAAMVRADVRGCTTCACMLARSSAPLTWKGWATLAGMEVVGGGRRMPLR